MTQIRTPQPNSKYYLPKEVFLTTVHFCKQYPYWLEELEALTDACKAIAYDTDRVQSSNNSDSTSALGMKRAAMSRKIDMIRSTAKDVAGHQYKWLILGCCYGKVYYQLRQDGIPFGKNIYYAWRRRFYYELSQKI